MTAKNNNAETINKIIKGIPIGRMGHTAEIAKAVSFLASIDASYINGHDLVVDGGHSIGGFNGDL
jgi:NAD(P)-dependent dehydrogenase (short-subunit alcohol dehydrogenase family)